LWDGTEYVGPLIHAPSLESAKLIAEYHGLLLDGELEAIIGTEIDFTKNLQDKVIH
tara:strand:+ start:330 stop:497 length:168 start_codon:yes stop_codon:yes gene_type:complete